MKTPPLLKSCVWPRSRAAFLAVTVVAALGLSMNTAFAQLEVAPPLFVDVDATGLSPGSLTAIINNGSLGGLFEARGGGTTVPVVAPVDGGGTMGILFDGGDYLQHAVSVGGALVPAPAGLVGVNPTCTIEAWVLNGAIDRDECILAWGRRGTTGANTAFGYGWDAAWGAVGHWGSPDIGWTSGQDGGGVYATNVPASGLWHHLAYTFDGTTQRVYSDGVLKNSEVVSLNTFSGPPIILASQTDANGTTVTATLRGSMTVGKVRIHDGVLNADQISTNYLLEVGAFTNGPGTQLISGPTHRYQFDNAAGAATAGSTILDSAGMANGTVLGSGATFTGSRLTLPGGASGTAAFVDLPDGLLSVNSTNKGGSGEVTIEGWAKQTASRTWARLFDFGSSSGGSGLDYVTYIAQVNAEVHAHRLTVQNTDAVGGTGGGGTLEHGSTTYGQDFHFAVTWNDATGEMRVFENGAFVGRRTEVARMTQFNDVNNWLGRSQWSGDLSLQGELDEFRTYNRVLSDAELRGNFLRGPDAIAAQLAMFNVTGGGAGCGGTSVGLSGSEVGVAYLLRSNSVYCGVAVDGNGSAISFGNQSVDGVYSVLASNTTTAVTALMSGSVAVTVNTAPWITSGPTPGNATNYQGSMLTFSIAAIGSGLTYQWQRDGTNLINGGRIAGANSENLIILPSDPTDTAGPGQGYTCVVSGVCGTPIVSSEATATVLPFVLVDADFDPGAAGGDGVYCVAMQANDMILVGGRFTTLAGQTRNCIGRFNADGTLDNGFNPGASGIANSYVYSLAVQSDGKTLVGGHFSTVGGQSRNRIARLNADGTLDSLFNPNANDVVFSLAPLLDGKILVGGQFTTLGGQPRTYIGRINPDGSLDSSFNPGANGRVYTVALQPDGKILLGGDFATMAGQPRSRIARLNADGTIDSTFNPGGDYSVLCLAVQADGKILVGGGFTNLGGQVRSRIARLNTDGSLDAAFNPGANAAVSSFALQTDGKIIVVGEFTNLSGLPCYRIGRLHADGSLDQTFNPGANLGVIFAAIEPEGRIFMGGRFTSVAGVTRNWIARLNNPDPATQSLVYDGSTISWMQGGTSPEVWRTTLEVATNGVDFFSLGSGERLAGGWQLAIAGLPAQTALRVRGYVTGGAGNSSAWFVEEVGSVSTGNNPPALANSIPNTNGVYGTPLSFEFAADTFADPDAGQSLTYSASGLPSEITFTPVTRTFSGTPTSVGTISVTVTATDNGSPALSTNDVFDIVIAKAPLSATADNKSRTYAETNPPLTTSYSSFVLGETTAVLDTPPTISTDATNGSPIGPYAITVGGGADDHYELSYVNGTLNITPATLTVTVNNTNRSYGALNPEFSGAIAGLANGDNITATFASLAETNSPVGIYPIVPALIDPNTGLGNYLVTTNPGNLTITTAPLTVTANDTNRVYGTTNPPLTGLLVGVVNDDNVTATFLTTATIADPPGTYLITPSLSDPDGKLGNYSVTTNHGTLTITSPPALSITGGPGGSITLSWSASYPDFVLEYTESLAPPIDWQEITSGIVESGGIKSYTAANDPNSPSRLYRLRLY